MISFADDLRAALERATGTPVELEPLHRRGEGYSWETYLVRTRAGERYAVKRVPEAGLVGDYDVRREVALLDAARDVLKVPVPGVVAAEPGERGFYVMELVAGEVPMPWDVETLLPDPAVRHGLGLELAEILARVHAVPPADLDIPGVAGPSTAAAEVERWRAAYLECAPVRDPLLDLAFAWLAYRADRVSGRTALVHNDLRTGNVIVREGRVAAVLDWETAAFGDPAADLAKFDLPPFRSGSGLAGGLLTRADLLAAYEAHAGWRPDDACLDWWTVLELAKNVVGSLRGAAYFADGSSRDLRYAVLGFRTHDVTRWLVQLYEDGTWGR
jgi:aminoglycoside phosphotransferase (APT) family kinase protein